MMCDPCAAAWSSWLDYKTPSPQPSLISPGIARVRDVVAARTERANATYRLIRQQTETIKSNCHAGRHVQPKA